ncbi:hypothetical protein [Catellatospora vulcania]|uniref:hypothetical protein n=1 Tax=Catellatospora vulcania TaxID=1460450 RepID=UPI0012D3FE5E|nr:hypothetical protein [Catellatospora vulcania]
MTDPYLPPPEPHHPDPPPFDPAVMMPPPEPVPHHDPAFDPSIGHPAFDPVTPDVHGGADPFAGGQPMHDPFPDPNYLPPDPPGFDPPDPGYGPADPFGGGAGDPPGGGLHEQPAEPAWFDGPDSYVAPDPPGVDDHVLPDPPGRDGYLPPDPPGSDGYVPPDPPGLDDYVAPDPPAFDASLAGPADPYAAPDPPGDYTAPDPPDGRAADVRDTAARTADGGGQGGAGLLFNFDVSEHFTEHGAGDATFHVSDLGTLYGGGQTVHNVTVVQGGTTYTVTATADVGRDGVVTVSIDIGGDKATIVLPQVAAGEVIIHIEPSKDPQKIADVTVSATVPVPIDVHSSRDVNIVSTVPFGPPAPPPAETPPQQQPQHHHARHQPEQPAAAPQPEPAPQTEHGRSQPDPAPRPTSAEAPPAHPDPAPAPDRHQPEQPDPRRPEPAPGQPDRPQPGPPHPGFEPVPPTRPHDPNTPTLDDLLRPDPPKTGFEGRLAEGRPFEVPVRVHSDVDVSRVVWLNQPPADPRHTRFEVVDRPDAHVSADERTFGLRVDPAAVMPIRDSRTGQLTGYRLRQGETMFTFDRNGRLSGAGNLEAPLEAPKVDPLDVMMIAVDLGPIVAKGLLAGAETIAAAAARQAPRAAAEALRGPTIARFGADEVKLLSDYWQQRLAGQTDAAARKEAEQALKALGDRGRIRNWRQSEREVAHIYEQIGGKGETTELYQDAAGNWGITKPDFTAPHVRGEVKNWETVHISSERAAEKLLDDLARQIAARRNLPGAANIPGRMQQTVVLDLRGQALSEQNLHTIGHVLAGRTGLPVENIQLIVWAK